MVTENLTYPENIERAVDFLRAKVDYPIQVGIVLGSGQSEVLSNLENEVQVPYKQIPFFPQSTVKGHKGVLSFGFLAGVAVAVMQGRVHAYEGHHPANLGFPIRVMANLGVQAFIFTNSAGAINTSYHPGDFIVIADHLNLMGINPLTGEHFSEWGDRFVDMSNAYHPTLRSYAKLAFEKNQIPYQEGVYAAMHGPTYETPAEVKMLRTLGADLAGMSTVPEVIVAKQMGVRVLAISLVTNMGAGIEEKPLHHDEVTEIAQKALPKLRLIIENVLEQIDAE
ncbi:MAG: purine-nucleoside phosphorylase [Candidatus Hydrogenedentota bacterium]|nr:MAG: purine-nucleoside phosphorylase [Candidatus Hydrogenedentota bacterium]